MMKANIPTVCTLYSTNKTLRNVYIYANGKQSDAECGEMGGFAYVTSYSDSATVATRQVSSIVEKVEI